MIDVGDLQHGSVPGQNQLLSQQQGKKSHKWFKLQQNKFGLANRACASGHLAIEERQIENFVFWHDRLDILKQVFDEA